MQSVPLSWHVNVSQQNVEIVIALKQRDRGVRGVAAYDGVSRILENIFKPKSGPSIVLSNQNTRHSCPRPSPASSKLLSWNKFHKTDSSVTEALVS